MSSRVCIFVVWIVLLLIIVYGALLFRYCNRVVDTDSISVLQCDAEAFQPDLLEERLPLVCSGFDKTRTFSLLYALQPEDHPDHHDVYSGLQHVCPWMSSPVPVRTDKPHPLAPQDMASYTQMKANVFMIVQTHGESIVWLIHPLHMSSDPLYTEVVLPKGTVLCIPHKWWYYIMHPTDNKTYSQYSLLSWKSWISVCV